MSLDVGSRVSDNVRLTRRLGQGGMGSVWVGVDERFDTEVAVKFIDADLLEKHPGLEERFRREAKAAAKIRSPHVVQILDHGKTAEGVPYIAMELLEGESLEDLLKRKSDIDNEAAHEILEQVSKALAAAHKHGIVHRDIKPANIFLQATDHDEVFVKVLDFGIAKVESLGDAAAGLTGTGHMLGTPQYMSPEQIVSAKGVDLQADVWALAVVAYRLITGRTPFKAETLGGLIVEITNLRYPPPSELGGPAHLDPVFARAFHKEVEQRFTSARELVRAIAGKEVAPPSALDAVSSRDAKGQTVIGEPLDVTPVPSSSDTPVEKTLMGAPLAADTSGAVPAQAQRSSAASPDSPASTTVASAPSPAATSATFAGASSSLHGAEADTPAKKFLAAGLGVALTVGAFGAWLALRGGDESTESGPSAAAVVSASASSASAGSEPSAAASAPPPSKPPPPGFAAIPAGKYTVGCTKGADQGCYEDEGPRHEVTVGHFAIMTREVKMELYDVCVADGGCPKPGKGKGCTWQRGGHEDSPINCVTWDGADHFCTSKGWRLPTEQEWEVAARGREARQYPWGTKDPTCATTWMRGSGGKGCGKGKVGHIGTKGGDRSSLGVFDLGGNVREWTSSEYGAYPGGQTTAGRSGMVNRGGSYLMGAEDFSHAYTRIVDEKGEMRSDLGFRCAVDL